MVSQGVRLLVFGQWIFLFVILFYFPQINNTKLNSNLEMVPFELYNCSESKLKQKDAKISLLPDENGALSTVSALIQGKVYRHLFDFDNHLDDISMNYWVNPEVNECIQQLVS